MGTCYDYRIADYGYMMSQELMSLDKVIGRIYAHMDRLANR